MRHHTNVRKARQGLCSPSSVKMVDHYPRSIWLTFQPLSDRLDPNSRGQPMDRAGLDRHHIVERIPDLDADHASIVVGAEVGKLPRSLNPWIPDHRRLAAFFVNMDAAMERGVLDDA